MADQNIICIARQFGSGGRDIGLALAKKLDIPFYDKELLQQAAKKSGILQELFEKNDEKPVSGLAGLMPVGTEVTAKSASFLDYVSYQPNDKLQNIIADVIRELADQGPCVIIGRCADYILRGRSDVLSAFIHADHELRVLRIAKMHNLDEDGARHLIRKTDRSRSNYYSYYTDRDWGAADNYHLCLDAGRLGVEKTADLLALASPYFAK